MNEFHIMLQILGSIITPAYVFYAMLTIILSINRLLFLMSSSLDQTLFSSKGMKVIKGKYFSGFHYALIEWNFTLF